MILAFVVGSLLSQSKRTCKLQNAMCHHIMMVNLRRGHNKMCVFYLVLAAGSFALEEAAFEWVLLVVQ